MKSQVAALISAPARSSGIPSNCKVSSKGNQVVLLDETSTKPFTQRGNFNTIVTSISDILGKVPATGNYRVISLCSEFSCPTIAQIRNECHNLLRLRFPKKGNEQPFPIGVGFVYDDEVIDLLSTTNEPQDAFDMIEAFEYVEAADLLECGLDKLRRIRDSVFVLRIGLNPFFEWVIVPKVDLFVQSPSMNGLPPNEKLIFILRQMPNVPDTLVQRFRNLSGVFRLIEDSFADIPTSWICHIATNVTLKSNASLLKVAQSITSGYTHKFNAYRSDLFYVRQDDEIESDDSEAYLAHLTGEELEELNYLKGQVGENSFYENKEEEEVNKKLNGQKSTSEVKFNITIDGKDNIYQNQFFLEDDFSSHEEEEEPVEYEEEEEEEKPLQIEDYVPIKKPKRKKSKVVEEKPVEEKPPEKTIEELAREEAERQAKEMAELEERRKQIEKLREMHKQKSASQSPSKQPSKKLTKEKSLKEISSSVSHLSRKDRVSERIQKLREMRETEEEDDEEESEQEIKRYGTSHIPTPYEKRQQRYNKIKMLCSKAKLAAKDPNTSEKKLRSYQEQISAAIEECQKFHGESRDEIDYLRETLKYRRIKHAKNQEDIGEFRYVYLEKHCENVDAETQIRLQKQGRGKNSKKIDPYPEYDMSVSYLRNKIEKERAIIAKLKAKKK